MSKLTSSLLLSLSALSFSSLASVHVTEGLNSRHFDFSVDAIKFKSKLIEGETFQEASLVGVNGYTGIKYEIGSPEVPVIRLLVKANSASDILINTKAVTNLKAYQLKGDLKPVMASVPKIAGATYNVVKNFNFKSSQAYPSANFEIAEAGSINSQKQFLVTLFPVQFTGSSNSLAVTKAFSVDVKVNSKADAIKGAEGLVFVVGAKFKNSASLANYKSVKTAQGFNVYTIDLPAKSPAEQTRLKIKALYSTKKDLKYAIIVGDASDVPGKQSKVINGLTDHYFSAIDTDNYDKDINGPDISVGRIAVADEAQLATVLKKYTRYIKGDFSSRSWLSNISWLATNDRWELAEGTHNYVIDSYTKNLGYSGSFPNDQELGGDKLYAITYSAGNTEVMSNITKGRSIIDYSGHGANTFWDAPRVEQSDVKSLTSETSSLPFVISNACVTADYRVDESFAETWQRHEWGAIMYYGSMDSSYWDEDDILERRMFDGIFKEGKANFGDITNFAMSEVWKQYGGANRSVYYWETYHMFGDPSVVLRLK